MTYSRRTPQFAMSLLQAEEPNLMHALRLGTGRRAVG